MTGNIGIRKLTAVLSFITILAAVFSPVHVSAAALPARGNLTIVAEYDRAALPGINMEIFLIATADYNGKLEYTATAQFADALKNVKYDPNGMLASENAEVAEKLKAYVSAKSLGGKTAETDGSGTAVFGNLEAGVYLVVQKPSATPTEGNNSRYVAQSFIIPVPYPEESGELNYMISAHPKIEPKKGMLTLRKVVSGSPEAPDSGFWFTVKFVYPAEHDREGVMLGGTKIEEELSLYLRAGGTAVFTNIPLGTRFEITEVNLPEGFTFGGITDGGKGVINAANPAKEITATNIYEPPPTTNPTTNPTTTPTTPPTTEPVTRWPTTQPTQPTSPPTRWTTQHTTTPTRPTEPATEPTLPAPTQPTINAPETDEEPEEYEDVDGSIPLGNITFTDTDSTPFTTVPTRVVRPDEEYEVPGGRVPQGNIRFPDDNPNTPNDPKENPRTGDNIMLVLVGSVLLCGIAVIVLKKKGAK